jgi:transposase
MTVTIGIDPHKATHTAVAIDGNEHVLAETKVRSSTVQADRLRCWAEPFDDCEWAIESARGLGYLLAQQLVAAGEHVIDVPPLLASRVRVLGSGRSQKNDPNDARSVAIAALRSDRLNIVRVDDHASVLKMLAKRHRDLGRGKTVACGRLHALLLELVPGGATFRMDSMTRINAFVDDIAVDDEISRQRLVIVGEFVEDIERYDTQLKASKKRIKTAVAASGTTLTEIRGLGPICAAMIIGHTGNVDRFPTKHHYATYNATAPIEASSGSKTRHRLNPRGNRQLNWAIHVIAVSQLRYDSPGRTYFDRKRAEGKTTKEAIRALKRRLSDVVYRHLIADARRSATS